MSIRAQMFCEAHMHGHVSQVLFSTHFPLSMPFSYMTLTRASEIEMRKKIFSFSFLYDWIVKPIIIISIITLEMTEWMNYHTRFAVLHTVINNMELNHDITVKPSCCAAWLDQYFIFVKVGQLLKKKKKQDPFIPDAVIFTMFSAQIHFKKHTLRLFLGANLYRNKCGYLGLFETECSPFA